VAVICGEIILGAAVATTGFLATHAGDFSAAVGGMVDAAGEGLQSLVVWSQNRRTERHIRGEIGVIEKHLSWLGGAGKGADPGPNDPDKWKGDVRRHLRRLQEKIDDLTGSRNQQRWQREYDRLFRELEKFQ
jgi:hypothetical protein